MLKVKDGISLTNGQFVKIDNGEIISAVPPDTQPLDATGVQTAMNTIIKYTEGDGGNDREVELIIPADSGNTAVSKISIKPLNITANAPFTFTDIYAANISSKPAADLYIKHQASTGTLTTKIQVSSALTTFDGSNKNYFEGFVSIGDSQETNIPLFVDADDTGANINSDDRSYFRYGQSNLQSNTGDWAQPMSIFATNTIGSNNYIFSHAGALTGSDDRIKSEEIPIENATDTLMKVVPKNYYKHASYRVDEENEAPIPETDASGNVIKKSYESGVISQDILKIPELNHLVNMTIDPKTDDDLLLVNYTQFIPFLIKSIQELNQRIVELESTFKESP